MELEWTVSRQVTITPRNVIEKLHQLDKLQDIVAVLSAMTPDMKFNVLSKEKRSKWNYNH